MNRIYKLKICLLTHHRLDKLSRLVKSVQDLEPCENLLIEPLIVVNTLNDEYYQQVIDSDFPFTVIRTESNGKPGKGKNSCLRLFLESGADFMSQIDGDDWLYPTFLKSLWQHIKHYPNIDVLGKVPVDLISKDYKGGHKFSVGNENQYVGGVWGVSLINWDNQGPGKAYWVDEDFPPSHDSIILQSRLSAVEKFDEDLPNGEDHLYSIQLLKLHKERKIRYFITTSSDLIISDRTLDDNIQNEFPFSDYVKEMKEKMLKYVNVNRSSQRELPIIYNDLLLSEKEKEEYIKKTFDVKYEYRYTADWKSRRNSKWD